MTRTASVPSIVPLALLAACSERPTVHQAGNLSAAMAPSALKRGGPAELASIVWEAKP